MSDETVEYRPARATMIYHWALALAMLVAASLVLVRLAVNPWPESGPWWAKAFLVAILATGVPLLLERAAFVTFTRVRSTAQELLVAIHGRRQFGIPWEAVVKAQTTSFDAWPAGRLRLLRLWAHGRKITIPLAKHPKEDEVFASIARRADLVPAQTHWRTGARPYGDPYWGASDWVRKGTQAEP